MFYQIDKSLNKTIFYDQKNHQEISSNKLISDIELFLDGFSVPDKSLCFIYCDQSYSTVLAYLSLLNSKHAIFLGDSKQKLELKNRIINTYKPRWIWSSNSMGSIEGYTFIKHHVNYLYVRSDKNNYPIHKDLKLLLSSSGSTGSPKMVRLSEKNLQSNASSIVKYLNINNLDITITSLPFNYSFGLSVLNSFLEADAKIILTNESIISRSFWELFKDKKVTFIAGVPYTFDILLKLNFEKMVLPNLNCMVQAGGRLSTDKISIFEKEARSKNFNFYVMYGQTEATARISYVPPKKLKEKPGSIGIPIPGGTLDIKTNSDKAEEGELVYEGPNVMLGYASSILDLANGDELKGRLLTGDLARKDKDGFFYLTGRLNRFLKLYGLRINLDEVEDFLNKKLICAAVCFGNDDCLQIRIESNKKKLIEKTLLLLKSFYGLHHSKIQILLINKIPRNESGKIQYGQLE